MANALLIGPQEKQQIADLVAKATASPVPLQRVQEMAQVRADGQETTEAFRDYTVRLPVGWRICFTHEEQRQATCRHISISHDKGKKAMHPAAVAAVLAEFGFVNKMGHMPGWTSHDPDGSLIVEFIEPLNGDCNVLRQP
jgi:hypothetical protein